MQPQDEDRRAALALTPVSRETEARLARFAEELRRWQRVKNLVSPASLDRIWTRHIADSLQLLEHAPAGAARWVDLGSGAGFPGLPIAIRAAEERPGLRVTLIESNGRKCAFLNAAIRATGAAAQVVQSRAETVLPRLAGSAEVVTARALAPLATLLGWAAPLLTTGAVGLFPKGREVERELTEAAACWRFDAELLPSRTDPEGRIVRVTALHERLP